VSTATDNWRLPGPGSFLRDVASQVGSGRHVVVVLPRYQLATRDFSNSLAGRLVDELNAGDMETRRLHPTAGGSLIAAVGSAMVFDEPPPTISAFLSHADATGKVGVLSAEDLTGEQCRELPAFLRRLEEGSRPLAPERRATLVVITDRQHLHPFASGDTSESTLSNVWWWNRVARWDAAARVAASTPVTHYGGLRTEVKAETIVEVARWSFDLADHLATAWDGRPAALVECIGAWGGQRQEALPRKLPPFADSTRPPEGYLDLWDDGVLEVWHDALALAPWMNLDDVRALRELQWRAQARVMLPWVEEQRVRLYEAVERQLGAERLWQAIRQFDGSVDASQDIVEIGALACVINARIGNSDPPLRAAGYALRAARNKIAHLEPLTPTDIDRLIRACREVT
jgi:hypothetical protein